MVFVYKLITLTQHVISFIFVCLQNTLRCNSPSRYKKRKANILYYIRNSKVAFEHPTLQILNNNNNKLITQNT